MVKDRSNWLPVFIAPFDTDLEVSVIEKEEVHRLMFPCRRTTSGWADTMDRRLKIDPSHWRIAQTSLRAEHQLLRECKERFRTS